MLKKLHIGIVVDPFGNIYRGGAEVQVENTIKALDRIEGISTEIITHETRNIDRFAIVHFFKSNIGYSQLALTLMDRNIPYVVSTVIFPENYLKDCLKYNFCRLTPLLNKIAGIKHQYMLWNNAKCLFPNTDQESLFLKHIGLKTPRKIALNGLQFDQMEEIASADLFYDRFPFLRGQKFVLNVARIDARKNQARLLVACKNLDLPLVVIGEKIDLKYFEKLKAIDYKKAYFLGPIFEKEIVYGAMKSCSVFCLPSTMETPGIAAMEAAFFNKPLVVTKYGGTKLYFKDFAYYVDWKSIADIEKGIALMLKKKTIESRDAMKEFSWDRIAQEYVNEYMKIIHN